MMRRKLIPVHATEMMRPPASYNPANLARVYPLGDSVEMSSSKVLIGDLSAVQLLRVRRLIEAQHDIQAIGPIVDPIELLLSVREMTAGVVILAMQPGGKAPGICTHLLAEYPELLVLALSEDGTKMFAFSNRIARRELVDGDKVILRTIRLVAAKQEEI